MRKDKPSKSIFGRSPDEHAVLLNDIDGVEPIIFDSAEARMFDADLQELSSSLEQGFDREPIAFLTQDQRDAILGIGTQQELIASRLPSWKHFAQGTSIATAACFALLLGIKFSSSYFEQQKFVQFEAGILEAHEIMDESTDMPGFLNLSEVYANLDYTEHSGQLTSEPLQEFNYPTYPIEAIDSEMTEEFMEIVPSNDGRNDLMFNDLDMYHFEGQKV